MTEIFPSFVFNIKVPLPWLPGQHIHIGNLGSCLGSGPWRVTPPHTYWQPSEQDGGCPVWEWGTALSFPLRGSARCRAPSLLMPLRGSGRYTQEEGHALCQAVPPPTPQGNYSVRNTRGWRSRGLQGGLKGSWSPFYPPPTTPPRGLWAGFFRHNLFQVPVTLTPALHDSGITPPPLTKFLLQSWVISAKALLSGI